MKAKDGIFALAAVALSAFALAGMVVTDEYAAAARTEARGMVALTQEVAGDAVLQAVTTPGALSTVRFNGAQTASASASAAVQQ